MIKTKAIATHYILEVHLYIKIFEEVIFLCSFFFCHLFYSLSMLTLSVEDNGRPFNKGWYQVLLPT